jgi:hypothetical protein
MTRHEGYVVDDELYCNLCAVDVFDEPEEQIDDDSNDYRKRDRESDDDDESESKRQRVNEKKTRDMMSKLTYESFDIWDLALDINNGDKEAALDMIEDRNVLEIIPGSLSIIVQRMKIWILKNVPQNVPKNLAKTTTCSIEKGQECLMMT